MTCEINEAWLRALHFALQLTAYVYLLHTEQQQKHLQEQGQRE